MHGNTLRSQTPNTVTEELIYTGGWTIATPRPPGSTLFDVIILQFSPPKRCVLFFCAEKKIRDRKRKDKIIEEKKR